MPRGGHRPGAGAPKNNLNAIRTGNRSGPVRDVYAAIIKLWNAGDEATLRTLFLAAFEAGALPPPSQITRHPRPRGDPPLTPDAL